MKIPPTVIFRVAPVLFSGPAAAQYRTMIERSTWGAPWTGGLGGMWIPILFVLAVLGGVAWVVLRNRK